MTKKPRGQNDDVSSENVSHVVAMPRYRPMPIMSVDQPVEIMGYQPMIIGDDGFILGFALGLSTQDEFWPTPEEAIAAYEKTITVETVTTV